MNIRITKIKYDGGTVEIHYDILSEQGNGDDIKTILKSTDKPKEGFLKKLSALAKHVEKICQLPEGYCSFADIRGVSFNYSHEIMGAVITALIKVETANSPVCINTPFLPSEQYNEGGEAPILPYECVVDLEYLLDLAEAYVNGDRDIPPDNQIKMDFSQDNPE